MNDLSKTQIYPIPWLSFYSAIVLSESLCHAIIRSLFNRPVTKILTKHYEALVMIIPTVIGHRSWAGTPGSGTLPLLSRCLSPTLQHASVPVSGPGRIIVTWATLLRPNMAVYNDPCKDGPFASGEARSTIFGVWASVFL